MCMCVCVCVCVIYVCPICVCVCVWRLHFTPPQPGLDTQACVAGTAVVTYYYSGLRYRYNGASWCRYTKPVRKGL
jgi:hypothetical protein